MATGQNPSIPAAESHERLICDICLEAYDDGSRRARFLECHHSFCSQCLVELAGRRQNNVRCPNCRRCTNLPENRVDGLQVNFYLEDMKEMSTTTDSSKTVRNTKVCHDHIDQPLQFFCDRCKSAICRDCTVVAHDKTAGHTIWEMKYAVADKRRALEDQLRESHDARKQIQKSCKRLESCMEKLLADKEFAIKNLQSMEKLAHELLERCALRATEAITQHHEAQQGPLLDKQHELDQTTTMLDKRISQSEELMKAGDVAEILNITEKLAMASGNAKSDSAIVEVEEISLSSDMITVSNSLNDELCDVWKKYLKDFLPSKFVLKSISCSWAALLDRSPRLTYSLDFLNAEDKQVRIMPVFLTITITDPSKCRLPVRLHTNYLECKFKPARKGKHQIAVMYLGQNLTSQQTDIFVEKYVFGLEITFKLPISHLIINYHFSVDDTGEGLS